MEADKVKITKRETNIELLRILCMFFVVLFHFNLNVILRNNETSHALNYFALLVNSLVVVAVNTFVLISGYFSIKLKAKSLISFFIQTEFYAVFAILILLSISIAIEPIQFTKDKILGLIPFIPSGLWFVPRYAILMCISPFLNRICKNKQTHLALMLTIAAGGVILYLLFCYQGYSIVNFILLYLIGRWIALYDKDNSKRQCVRTIVSLIISVAFTFGLSVWWLHKGHDVADKTIFAYCTPWVILSSVSLFVLFKNISVKNSWINVVASSVFSVYLFHENGLIKQFVYIKPLKYLISQIPNDIFSYLCLIAYAILLFVIVVLFDRYVRIRIQDKLIKTLNKEWCCKLLRLNK